MDNKTYLALLCLTILVGCLIIFGINFASASDYKYEQHTINKDFYYSFTSNNATQCNVTTGNTPYGLTTINQVASKVGSTFSISISKGNFSQAGDYCFNLVCTDNSQIESGSVCRSVTPSGFADSIGLYIVLLVIITLIILLGYKSQEEWFIIIGSLGLMMFGLFTINNGIAGYKDMFMTWGVGLFEIGIGFTLSIIAGLSKMDIELNV